MSKEAEKGMNMAVDETRKFVKSKLIIMYEFQYDV